MKKLPSYEDLQKKIAGFEKELAHIKLEKSQIPYNIEPNIFFKISEYSKNAITLFETHDNGESFIIKYFNKKAQEIEKVNRHKITGKDLSKEFPSVQNSGFLDVLKRVYKSSEPEEFPAIVFSSGKIIEWKHNYIYKLSDTELVSIYIDETENKNKEYELKEHREKLQIAMEAASYFSFEINLPTYKIKTLHDLYKSLEYEDSEIKALMDNAGSLIHHDDFEKTKKLIIEHEKRIKSSLHTEFRIKHKDGTWKWFMATGKIIEWDTNSNPIRLVGLVKNIQEEKEIHLKLQESEENFRQLAENINDAFWLRSLDNQVIYANPACYTIAGENFLNIFEDFDSYKEWIHPEDKEHIVMFHNDSLKNPNQNHHYEYRIVRPDGKIKWLWLRTFPVFNKEGALYRRAGIASDITEQKQLMADLLDAKEKAEESDKLKSAFLANMSHEIRTPMNGILGFAELLKDDDITENDKIAYLKIIDSNGKQLLNLINDIIDVAKIEAKQIRINKKHIDIKPVLEEVRQLFTEEQRKCKKENIEFNLKVPDGNHLMYTDVSRFQQILCNLLSNAFKFTDSGSISFGYEVINKNDSSHYKFFVSDTGIGINEIKKEYIFERFGQIHPKKTKNQQGTGLGLAISKGLIKLIGGKIWFESVPEDINLSKPGNTTFYFTIPIINHSNSNKSNLLESKPTHEMKTFENIEILVVEDDEDNLEFLRRLLLRYGANVTVARTGNEAIDIIKTNKKIRLVLMDIRLPDITGFETTQKIKALNPDLPVIAQTAYAMHNDRDLCIENGCDDYISKPLDKDVLFKKINHYIYN